MSRTLHILYATQTGNAMELAESLAREAQRRLFKVVLLDIEIVKKSMLPQLSTAVFIISTTGQGAMPTGIQVFSRI
jgi:sulfite reductase alpha subunit-like flavoprotein